MSVPRRTLNGARTHFVRRIYVGRKYGTELVKLDWICVG